MSNANHWHKMAHIGRLVESGLVDLWMKEMGDLAKQENKNRIRKVKLCLGKGPYIHGPLLKKGLP